MNSKIYLGVRRLNVGLRALKCAPGLGIMVDFGIIKNDRLRSGVPGVEDSLGMPDAFAGQPR